MRRPRRCCLQVPCTLLAVSILAAVWQPPPLVAGTFEAKTLRELRDTNNQIRAAQFLSKATFGPTQQDVDALGRRMSQIGALKACEEWIDQQFALPASSHKQTALDIIAVDGFAPTDAARNISRYRYQAWWHIALTSEDQLPQRMAWALAQIFVIGQVERQRCPIHIGLLA